MVPYSEEALLMLKSRFPKVDFLRPDEISGIENIDVLLGWDFKKGLDLIQEHNIKWVQSVSAGIDYFPLNEFKKRQIVLTKASGLNSERVANFVLMSCLSVSFSMNRLNHNKIQKKWEIPDDLEDSKDQNVIIFGTGHTGSIIASILKNFYRKVDGVNTTGNNINDTFDNVFIIDDILKREPYSLDYSIVINCLPETSKTIYLFNKKLFNKFSDKISYINVGRGETTNTTDLLDLISNGKIRNAILDVFEQEPLSSNSLIWDCSSITVTPHIAGMLPHFRNKFFDFFANNLSDYLNNTSLRGIVNYDKEY